MTLVISNFSYLGPYAWFIKYGRKRWQYKFALLLLIEVTYNMFNFYPVRICAAGLCIWLHRFVYVYVCVYIFGYICGPKTGFWGLNTGKSPASVIYCSLVVFNDQKKGLTTPGDSFWERNMEPTILLTGRKKGSGKLYYSKPHLVYIQCTMQLCNANECRTPTYYCSADLQYRYRYSLYWQCLEHTGYMFYGILVLITYSNRGVFNAQ